MFDSQEYRQDRPQGTAGLPMSYRLGHRWDDVTTWFDFKSETSFGFLSPNYMGQCTYLIFL